MTRGAECLYCSFYLVCQMAKMAAAKIDLQPEKKDICILVEMVAGVGLAFDSLKKESKYS